MLRLIFCIVAGLQIDTVLRALYMFFLDRRAHKILRRRLEEITAERDVQSELDFLNKREDLT